MRMTFPARLLGFAAAAVAVFALAGCTDPAPPPPAAPEPPPVSTAKPSPTSSTPKPKPKPKAEPTTPAPQPTEPELPTLEWCQANLNEYGNPPQECLDAYPEAGDANVADPDVEYFDPAYGENDVPPELVEDEPYYETSGEAQHAYGCEQGYIPPEQC